MCVCGGGVAKFSDRLWKAVIYQVNISGRRHSVLVNDTAYNIYPHDQMVSGPSQHDHNANIVRE